MQFYHKRNLIIPSKLNMTNVIQDIIKKSIDYFDVAYPFPKVDFVLLPGDIEHENAAGLFIGG